MDIRYGKRVITAGAMLATAIVTLACDPSAATQPLPALTFGASDSSATDSTSVPDTTAAPDTTVADSSGAEPIPAEQIVTLFSSSASGIADERRQVIEENGPWGDAWAELNAHLAPTPPTPSVDFGASRVILVTSGARPNGGHRLELVEVASGDGGLTVTVNDVVPGPGCLVTQQISHPALAISVPIVGDSVTISVVRVYADCG